MNAGRCKTRLKVAIIGGGPGGLGAANELSRLSFVDWNLYEKKGKQSTETSGGISLQPHTWRLLDVNQISQYINEQDYFRPPEGEIEQRCNGRSGALVLAIPAPFDTPREHRTCRLARSKLQAALLKGVDDSKVHFRKKLNRIEHLSNGRIRIKFEDGFCDEVDLLIAADGIRSLTRQNCFPGQKLRYNGQCVYRTIVSQTKARKVAGIPWAPVFWKHKSGLYVYTCPLGGDEFEVTVRIRQPKLGQGQVSWGRPFDLHNLLHEFTDFCQPVQEILQLAAKGNTQEFALIEGSRSNTMVYRGNTVFIGDAAHALCGNFGAGAGFALEDVHALAESLAWAEGSNRSIADALDLYDTVRSPHYKRLYSLLDKFADIKNALRAEELPIDEDIEARVLRIAEASESWMYHYEIDSALKAAIEEAEGSHKGVSTVLVPTKL